MPAGKKNNRKEKKERSNQLKISDDAVSKDQAEVAKEQPPVLNKFKNNRRQEVMSLQNIIIKYILENITLFCDKDKFFTNLQNLSKDVRNKILEGLSAEKLKCKGRKPVNFKGFSLLLNDKTQELHLVRLVSIFPKNTAYRQDQQVKILTLIATEAFNVSTLDVGSGFCFDFYQEGPSRTAIYKMQNIETLIIQTCHLTYPSLMDLCKNLRNLKYLKFSHLYFPLNCDLSNLEEFKSCLSGLKELNYVPDEMLPDFHLALDEQLYRNCVQHLPQIEIVQVRADALQWMVLSDRLVSPWSINQLPEGPSALRHLSTTPTSTPLHTAFPEVTHLMVTWKDDWFLNRSETGLLPLLQFSKIETLQLVNPPSASIVDRFLKSYGPGLQTLIIHQAAEPITFDRTLPRLTQLKLNLTPLSNLGFDSQEVFPQLKELEWTLAEQPLVTNAFRLSFILSSPTLRKVKIHRIYPDIFHLLDLQYISVAMNDEQPILRNLKNLNLGFYCEYCLVNLRTKSFFQAAATLVKSACNQLTNLSTVEFTVRPGGKKQLLRARIEELKRFVDDDQEFFDCLVNFRIGA